MVRTLYILGMALLALATAICVDVFFPDEANAGPWTGCYGGALGSYNAAVMEDVLGAEGPGIAATLGCDVQSGPLVFGAAAEYGWRTFDFATIDVDARGWEVIGRAGYLATPQTLLYGLVGWTDLEADIGPFGSVDVSGVAFGGGTEIDMGKGLFARLEYQRLVLEPDDIDVEANVNSFRAGLVYKFNVPEVTAPFEGKPLK